MKTILIILDGVSEEKVINLNNMTPLEFATTPVLNKIIDEGSHGKTIFCPQSKVPDSLNCILSILGVDKSRIPRNRAYLESLASGINIEYDEAVLRCNLVSIRDNKLESFNGKGLTSQEMRTASAGVITGNEIKFYHIGDYRNLLVLKKNSEIIKLKDISPHDNIGRSTDEILKFIRNINVLNQFILNNVITIKDKSYMFYPWGVSEKIILPSFKELHNKSCSCICNAQIVKGMAKAMKIDLVHLEKSTGDTDTDLLEKAQAVLREIKTHDTVIAHINGTDEVSHRKDIWGKINFIEKIDEEFLSEIYNNVEKDTQIIILSDHQTSSITGKHEKGYVDIITNVAQFNVERNKLWQK